MDILKVWIAPLVVAIVGGLVVEYLKLYLERRPNTSKEVAHGAVIPTTRSGYAALSRGDAGLEIKSKVILSAVSRIRKGDVGFLPYIISPPIILLIVIALFAGHVNIRTILFFDRLYTTYLLMLWIKLAVGGEYNSPVSTISSISVSFLLVLFYHIAVAFSASLVFAAIGLNFFEVFSHFIQIPYLVGPGWTR